MQKERTPWLSITCTYNLCVKLLYIHSFDAKRISVPASNFLLVKSPYSTVWLEISGLWDSWLMEKKLQLIFLVKLRLDKIWETSGVGVGKSFKATHGTDFWRDEHAITVCQWFSIRTGIVYTPTQFLSHVWLFVTPWTVAHQAPLSMRWSWQEYWSGLPFSPPGDLPNPGIEPMSPVSPALAGGFFTTLPPGKPPEQV